MPVYVGGAEDGQIQGLAVTALMQSCNDPAISIDWTKKDRTLRSSGQVIYDNPTVFTEPCMRLFNAVHQDIPVVVRAVLPGTTVYYLYDTTIGITTREPVIARDQPGFTRPNFSDAGVLVSIDVVIEPTNDTNRGYWCLNVNDEKILEPAAAIVAHEFGHVDEILAGRYYLGATDEEREKPAIEAENVWRRIHHVSERWGHEGGNDLRKERGGLTGGDCFVATAAYGSELEDPVQELRNFRDDILLHTRSGADFFDTYFEQYYKLSPAIVTLMHTDPQIKELVRWSVVAPVVQFLRLAKDFPRADTADVPEPWRSYLESARESFEEWTAHLPRPTTFDDVPVTDAAEELRVTLEHFTWRDDDAAEYVASLRAAGALPLKANPQTLEALATMLESRGARVETIFAVTGIDLSRGSEVSA